MSAEYVTIKLSHEYLAGIGHTLMFEFILFLVLGSIIWGVSEDTDDKNGGGE